MSELHRHGKFGVKFLSTFLSSYEVSIRIIYTQIKSSSENLHFDLALQEFNCQSYLLTIGFVHQRLVGSETMCTCHKQGQPCEVINYMLQME